MDSHHDNRPLTQVDFSSLFGPSVPRGGNQAPVPRPRPLQLPKRLEKPKPASKPTIHPRGTGKVDTVHNVTKQNHPVNQPISLSAGRCGERYTKYYSLQVGNKNVPVVLIEKPGSNERVGGGMVREFVGKDATKQVQAIQSIRHPRFVKALDKYKIEDGFLVVFELIPLPLIEIATVHILETSHVAAIFQQVIDGLLYLKENCLEHDSLTCNNVLVDNNGQVKIWGQEFCHVASVGNLCKALHSLMLEFLQIYDTDKSTDKSRDADQVSSHWYWSERKGVIDFLSAIGDAATEVSRSPSKDASSLEKLSKHDIFLSCDPKGLAILLPFITARISWLVSNEKEVI